MLQKAFTKLGPMFGGEIDPAFTEFNNRLSDIQQMEKDGLITQEQSNVMRKDLLDATTDREKQREAQKTAELQSSKLTKIGDAIGGLGTKLGEYGKGAVKTGGLLAGLIGLVIGVVDPELLSTIIQDFVQGFLEIVEGLVAFINGDFETAKTKIGDNILLFGGLVLGLAAYFGGPLITAFGGIFTKLGKVVNAIKVFRTFMVATFVPTMIASLTSMGTMMGFAAGSLGVVLAPVLAIVAVIGLLYAGFKALNSGLGPGASIMDTLKVGMLYFVDFLAMIVNGITFIPRKILGFLGPRLMKWIMGDDFDTSTIDNLAKGFETNRGAQAAEEIRLKNEKAAAQKAMEEELNPDTVIIPDNTTGIDLTTLGDETSAAQIAATTVDSGTQVMGANITNNTSSQAATTIMAVQPNPSRLALEGISGR